MKYIFLFLSILYLCESCAPAKKNAGKPVVTVSIIPLRYVIERLSGGDFEAIALVPAGTNPEIYEPTAAQMKAVSESELFFQTGLLDFEQALRAGIENNAPDLEIVDLSADLPLIEGHHGHAASGEPAHALTATDPHVWLSPARMRTMAGRITEKLCAVRPDSAGKYERNRDLLISSIDSLDRHIRHSFSELDKNKILIYHPSLTYYADDYGLHQLSVETDGKEPSATALRNVVQEVRENGIRTIFYQKQLNLRTIEALCLEAGLQAVVFDPLAGDWLANLYTLTDEIRKSLSDE
jgi:zinc transport system substrate-binding protein